MFLIFLSLASVMNVIGRIRVIAPRWVWRVIFRCLRQFFFFVIFFFFALESDDDVSNKSEDEGFGSGFTSGLCVSSCFELSVDRVSWLLSSQVTIFIGSVRWIFSMLEFSRSQTSLFSISGFLNMITVSCCFAHILKIMRLPKPITPFRAPPQPVTVLCSGSNDEI